MKAFFYLKILCSAFVTVVLLLVNMSYAETEKPQQWINLTWENDFIAGDDSGYTNGIGVSWGYAPFAEFNQDNLPDWLYSISQLLPYSSDASRTHAVSYRMAQLMYTPGDIRTKELIEDDRPYAGVLLWSVNLHSFDKKFSNRHWLSLGAIGPISGAEQVQKLIHEIIHEPEPMGWNHQLHNEAVFLLANERLYRFHSGSLSNNLEYDIIGMTELMAGTLRSEVGSGIGFRWGRSLQQSFSSASLIPGRNINPLTGSLRSEWHAFINLFGRYVFNDITLDGNYFHDSHSVTLTHPQAVVSIGAAWHGENWGVITSIQESSRSFEERRENSLFGSISVTWQH